MDRQASDTPLDFEDLVREHSGRIRQIARRFAANGAVDDLVQDILTLVPDEPGMAIFACCGLVYGFTYWFVRRETKRKWDPVLARLQRLHADLISTPLEASRHDGSSCPTQERQ